MPQNKYKVGLIGCGHWGQVLLRNFLNNKNFEVKMVCDHNLDKLGKLSAVTSRVKTCMDQDEVFEDEAIDVVAIATQANTHYKLVRQALLHNKHVFVEKPFTLSSAEARMLIKLNREKKLIIMVDHTYLFSCQYLKVKKLLRSQRIGRPLHFHSTRADFGLFQRDANVLWHLLYHDLYILLDLFSEYKMKAVRASGSSHLIRQIEDVAYAAIQYEKGLTAGILVNMLFPKKVRTVIVAGEKGLLLWDDISEDKLTIYKKRAAYNSAIGRIVYQTGEEIEKIKVAAGKAIKNELDYFAACLKTKTSPHNNEKAAGRVIGLLEKIDAAMRIKWEKIK